MSPAGPAVRPALDAIVIGAGHNGLVAAASLAQAGRRALVLERSPHVGGCATTSTIAPGFRCPALVHTTALDRAVARTLDLERHGLHRLRPAARAAAPAVEGRGVVLWADVDRAVRSIEAVSPGDAARYPEFLAAFSRMAAVVRAIQTTRAPSLDSPGPGEILRLIETGRRFRSLGRKDAYRLLRAIAQPVADLTGEWFESEPLRAAVAAGGVIGSFLGPRSAGSGAVLLWLGAGEAHPIGTDWIARGGPGSVSDALADAARARGAAIRTSAEVRSIAIRDGRAQGVVLSTGEELLSRVVISSADPKRTLLGLVDPVHLTPEFLRRVRSIRMRGTLAKINYAVGELPRFTGLERLDAGEQRAALSGLVRLARDTDVIERAFDAVKYGRYAAEPWIELTVPSILDDTLAPSGRHVVSACVQYAPYAPYAMDGGDWNGERDRFADAATRTIAAYAPGFEESILARQILAPPDLERTLGLSGGHIFHGELALDQLYIARPLLGWARYATPIANLYLCGSATHPGPGLTGRSGMLAVREILSK